MRLWDVTLGLLAGVSLLISPGRSFGETLSSQQVPISVETAETNLCTDQLLMADPHVSTNTRLRPKAQGKLTAADLHRLQLKWAFGYANVSSAKPQPTVAGGRLFAASENGNVYALNPRTGCRYWTFKAQAGVPTAVVVGPYRDAQGNPGFAVYFGDRQANAYAVDAQTGRPVWARKVDEQAAAAIAGSLAIDDGRVFVPVAGDPCCNFRGSLSALDASLGTVIWKTYTVSESVPRLPGPDGTSVDGPASGGISSVPTVDMKQHIVYVTTGNGDSGPAQPLTDTVFALDVYTGTVKGSQQAKPAPPPKLCGVASGCSAAVRGGPLDAIPGAVLNGALDGSLRAYSTKDGSILWTFDTNRDFDTVNGVKAHGGSMDSVGPVVVDGMLYVSSGTGGSVGRPGNVLLAFGLPERPRPKARSNYRSNRE